MEFKFSAETCSWKEDDLKNGLDWLDVCYIWKECVFDGKLVFKDFYTRC